MHLGCKFLTVFCIVLVVQVIGDGCQAGLYCSGSLRLRGYECQVCYV
jgi:hypothetical protein